jgi:hypothetical protein
MTATTTMIVAIVVVLGKDMDKWIRTEGGGSFIDCYNNTFMYSCILYCRVV